MKTGKRLAVPDMAERRATPVSTTLAAEGKAKCRMLLV